jgi:hypothetical protein
MYEVLRPVYHPKSTDEAGRVANFAVTWLTMGVARDMEEAKRLYPWPILKWCGRAQ